MCYTLKLKKICCKVPLCCFFFFRRKIDGYQLLDDFSSRGSLVFAFMTILSTSTCSGYSRRSTLSLLRFYTMQFLKFKSVQNIFDLCFNVLKHSIHFFKYFFIMVGYWISGCCCESHRYFYSQKDSFCQLEIIYLWFEHSLCYSHNRSVGDHFLVYRYFHVFLRKLFKQPTGYSRCSSRFHPIHITTS